MGTNEYCTIGGTKLIHPKLLRSKEQVSLQPKGQENPLKNILDIIDKYTVTHLDYFASGQTGFFINKDYKIGAEANITFGYAVDSENIALYGNTKLVTISNNEVYDINSKIEKIHKFLLELISKKDMVYINEEKSQASVEAQTIRSKDYVITKNAYLAKRNSYNFDGGLSNDF